MDEALFFAPQNEKNIQKKMDANRTWKRVELEGGFERDLLGFLKRRKNFRKNYTIRKLF